MTDFLLRFRGKTTEALQQMETDLEAEETVFISQGMGNTTMTRDLRLIQDKLNAIAYVLQERNVVKQIPAKKNNNVGISDFSGINGAGTGSCRIP